MDRDIERSERRIEQLFAKAVSLQIQRPEEALAAAREALRSLAELEQRRSVEGPVDLRVGGGLLYTCGNIHIMLAQYDDALDALDEAEAKYRTLVDRGDQEAVPLLADVWSRRSRASFWQGRGATAVVDADQAVSCYLQLATTGAASLEDLARVLAQSARVVMSWGDPTMGRRLAEEAIGIYVREGISPQDPMHGELIQEVQELLATSAERAPVSLAEALDWAADRLGDRLLAASTRDLLVVPDENYPLCQEKRVPGEVAPMVARVLADLAVELIEEAPGFGVRLGLEAHYLFHSAYRQNVPRLVQGHGIGEFVPAWAAALHAIAEAYRHQAKGLSMALDLSRFTWHLVPSLKPFITRDPAIAPLVLKCVRQHGEVLIASGETELGEEILASFSA